MFTKIHDGIWASLKRKGVSLLGRELFIYLFSNEHRNIIGAYKLPLEYMAGDLGEPLPKVKATVKELLDKGLIYYDFDTDFVIVKGFLEHNALINANAIKSAVEKVSEIPNTLILQEFLTVLEQLPNSYPTVISTVKQQLANKERYKDNKKKDSKKEDKDEGYGCSNNNSAREEKTNEDVARVMTFYMDRINATPSSTSCEELLSYIPVLSADVVIKAMSIALDEHKPQWSYIRGILRTWTAQDVKTLEDVQRLQDIRDSAKSKGGEGNAGIKKCSNDRGNGADKTENRFGDLAVVKLG